MKETARKRADRFRKLSADRLNKSFKRAAGNVEALDKIDKAPPPTQRAKVNTAMDSDVQTAAEFLDERLASLEDAKKVPDEIWNFEVTV
jgi:hypothetical protein